MIMEGLSLHVTFTGLLFIGYCEKSQVYAGKPDLSDEKRLLSAEKIDNEISLLQIDKQIQQELLNPTAPEVSFEIQLQILKKLVKYHNQLTVVYEGVKNNSANKLQVAQELIKQNGPEFLKEEINEDKLKQVYNWDEESVDFFRDSLQDIKLVWNNITINLKEKPTPMQIYLNKTLGL